MKIQTEGTRDLARKRKIPSHINIQRKTKMKIPMKMQRTITINRKRTNIQR